MEGLVLWIVMFVADGAPRGGSFGTAERCQAAIEELSKYSEVSAVSECVSVRLRAVAPSEKVVPAPEPKP